MGHAHRTFSLERRVSRKLDDEIQRGERSAFVNEAIKDALRRQGQPQC